MCVCVCVRVTALLTVDREKVSDDLLYTNISKNGEGEDVGSTNHEPLLKQQASERARSDAPSAGVTTTNDLRRNRVQQSVQPTSLDTPEREGPLSHKRSKNLTVR